MTENKQQRRLLLLYTTIQGSSSFFNLEIYSRRSAASHFFTSTMSSMSSPPLHPCLPLSSWQNMVGDGEMAWSTSFSLFSSSPEFLRDKNKKRKRQHVFVYCRVSWLVGDSLGKVEICKSYILGTKSPYSFIPNKSEKKDKIKTIFTRNKIRISEIKKIFTRKYRNLQRPTQMLRRQMFQNILSKNILFKNILCNILVVHVQILTNSIKDLIPYKN